jgi:hypothetical protein
MATIYTSGYLTISSIKSTPAILHGRMPLTNTLI